MDQIQAEKQIARILAQLETDAGRLVERVDIRELEVYQDGDTCRQFRTVVNITMTRLPDRKWL